MTSSLSSHPLHDLSVHALASARQAKQVSSVEVATHFLERARQHQHLGAYVAVDESVTLDQARAADARIAQGNSGPPNTP